VRPCGRICPTREPRHLVSTRPGRQVLPRHALEDGRHLLCLVNAEAVKLRKPPLLHLNAEQILHVKDFGAIINDGLDDLAAIQAAFKAAAQSKIATEVLFESGTYHLEATNNELRMELNDASEVTINGNGALLIIRNPKRGLLRIDQSKRLIIKNLLIDYSPRPNSQGIIQTVDKQNKRITIKLTPNAPTIDRDYFRSANRKWGFIKENENPRLLKAGMKNMVQVMGWEKIDNRTFEIQLAKWTKMDRIKPSDPYVQIARHEQSSVFYVRNSSWITFKNIRIFSCPSISYLNMHCSYINFIGCKTIPEDGFWHSSGADGIYSLHNRVGPWIEGCVFDATGDDAIVIKTSGANCIKKINDRTFLLAARPKKDGSIPSFSVKAGDLLRIYDPYMGLYIGEAIVTSTKKQQDESIPSSKDVYEVVFNKPFPELEAGVKWESPIWYNDNLAG